MKLFPVPSVPEPRYPSRQPAPSWKRTAASLTAAAALWFPACGSEEEPCDVRTGGVAPTQVSTEPLPNMPGTPPATSAPDAGQQPLAPPPLPEGGPTAPPEVVSQPGQPPAAQPPEQSKPPETAGPTKSHRTKRIPYRTAGVPRRTSLD